MVLPEWFPRMKSSGSGSEDRGNNEQEVELEDFSAANERSKQILADINSGSLTCVICTDPVTRADVDEYKFWQCLDCYNICHFPCALAISTSIVGNWRCPSCRSTQPRLISATCWCGEPAHSCTGRCLRQSTCPHGQSKICRQACHPGPCSISCVDACATLPGIQDPTCWSLFCDRWKNNGKDIGIIIARLLVAILILLGAASTLDVLAIRWMTEPNNHPPYIHDEGGPVPFLQTMGIVIVFILSLVTMLFLLRVSGRFFNKMLNLEDLTTKKKRKVCTKYSGAVLGVLLGFVVVLLPFVMFFAGPGIVWYNMMKGSCNGFDLRIDMNAGSRFEIRSSTPDVPSRVFYYASRLEPATHSNDSFQYFHRISGSTPQTKHVAVDVDTNHRRWRLLKLNGNDTQNEWLAYGYKHDEELPDFSNISAEVMKNGTWLIDENDPPHMHIPELDMAIPRLHSLTEFKYLKPFIQVIDTYGMNQTDLTAMLNKRWSSKSYDRVVMKMASFGHRRQDLELCVKGHDQYLWKDVGENELRLPQNLGGIDDKNLIPLAILMAGRNVSATAHF